MTLTTHHPWSQAGVRWKLSGIAKCLTYMMKFKGKSHGWQVSHAIPLYEVQRLLYHFMNLPQNLNYSIPQTHAE